jgi:hypothetical protein
LYVGGDLENNGGSQTVDGDYNACYGEPVKDIITTSEAGELFQASDWTGGCGTFCDMEDNGTEYPIHSVVNHLFKRGTEFEPSNNLVLGDSENDSEVYYHFGNIEVMNNLDGYGVFIVDGNVTFGGNISWHGIMLITGNVTFNGGGSKQIYGSVIVGGDVLGNGSVDILYDCDTITKIQDKHTFYARRWWRDT